MSGGDKLNEVKAANVMEDKHLPLGPLREQAGLCPVPFVHFLPLLYTVPPLLESSRCSHLPSEQNINLFVRFFIIHI